MSNLFGTHFGISNIWTNASDMFSTIAPVVELLTALVIAFAIITYMVNFISKSKKAMNNGNETIDDFWDDEDDSGVFPLEGNFYEDDNDLPVIDFD